jgi:hypothetical protein
MKTLILFFCVEYVDVSQLATAHFASTSIDGFSKITPQSFAQLLRDDQSAPVDVPRAADPCNLRTCHRHPPTVPCLPSGPPNLCEPHLRSIGQSIGSISFIAEGPL